VSPAIERHARTPLGLLVPTEPFELALDLAPADGERTVEVRLYAGELTRASRIGRWRFAVGRRDALTLTLDAGDAGAPVRADAPLLQAEDDRAAELATAPRVQIYVEELRADTGEHVRSDAIPWVRDANALADAHGRLDPKPWTRALAPPALPLAPDARVHVAAVDVREGDAIGNLALDAARALRGAGHDVRLWARHASPELLGACGALGMLGEEARPGDLVLYQYSIFDAELDVVLDCPATKVCFYQGITPPRFLAGVDEFTEAMCRRGLETLPRLARFDGWIAATRFTADELRAAIGREADVRLVPPTLGLGRFDALDPEPVPLPGSGRFLLYVGRFAPHKGVGLLLDAFAAYAPDDPKCDLVLAGMEGGVNVAALRAALPGDLAARVHVVRRPSDAALKALYQACTAYVSASEHEGFCVPLAEAMGFGKPVFAFDTPSVRETLSGAGQLFAERDPRALAVLWRRVLHDPAELERRLAGQQRRWRELHRAADGHLLWDALADAMRRSSGAG
jgi:glycosyltransferase involved in cell wall biosynthesis